jgi:TolA-binding protein
VRAGASAEGRAAARNRDAGGAWGPERPTSTPTPDFQGAGIGWRSVAPRSRPPEAQAAYEQALALLATGQVNGAIALLRRALSMSPGDPDVAEALGKLAFKDRLPGR